MVKNNELYAVGFGLDLTKREIQSRLKTKGLPWERAKAFDKAAVFSKFVLIPNDSANIRMELSINGQLKQSGGYDLMQLKPHELLAEIQTFITLNDDDIIMTGTPSGVGELQIGDRFVGKIFSNKTLLIESSWIVR